ncbi:hypothetical protein FRC17_006112, partial [Serendipita sp. 399]
MLSDKYVAMKPTSILVSLSTLLSVRAVAFTSTIFWGDCWTQADGGTITTSIPATTTTLVLPEPTTLTITEWIYPPFGRREAMGMEKANKKKREGVNEETTIFMVNQCTHTRTATVTSTVRQVVPTLTATVTRHASTA